MEIVSAIGFFVRWLIATKLRLVRGTLLCNILIIWNALSLTRIWIQIFHFGWNIKIVKFAVEVANVDFILCWWHMGNRKSMHVLLMSLGSVPICSLDNSFTDFGTFSGLHMDLWQTFKLACCVLVVFWVMIKIITSILEWCKTNFLSSWDFQD